MRVTTLRPAEILGLEGRPGSLTPGKIADVVITNTDLLETTLQVRHVHVTIDGEQQDTGNRQREFYCRCRTRQHALQSR